MVASIFAVMIAGRYGTTMTDVMTRVLLVTAVTNVMAVS